MSRAQIATAAARLPPALSPPMASLVGSMPTDAPLAATQLQPGHDVVEGAREARLGRQPVVDGEHHDAGLHRELGAEHVVAVEIAEHPAAAMGVHQRRQLGVGRRRGRPIEAHGELARRSGNGALDHLAPRRPRTLGAGRSDNRARAPPGRERVPGRPIGRGHQVDQALRFGIERHSSNSIRPNRICRHSGSLAPLFRHETNGKVSHDLRTGLRRVFPAAPSWWRRSWTASEAFRPGLAAGHGRPAAAPGRRAALELGLAHRPRGAGALLSGGRPDRPRTSTTTRNSHRAT